MESVAGIGVGPRVKQHPLVTAAAKLAADVNRLSFSPAITHVYNPLDYAFEAHSQYVNKYAHGKVDALLMGMNPGPFGMAQNGVPFGQVEAVRDWLGIDAPIGKPKHEHPKRPVDGWQCTRSEVSGQRLWGWAKTEYGTPEAFFARYFVANYCPLVFMEESGRNFTPDKLPAAEQKALFAACDEHLQVIAKVLQPKWVIGVGAFAEQRIMAALPKQPHARILHPSPASPLANKNWAGEVKKTLHQLGL